MRWNAIVMGLALAAAVPSHARAAAPADAWKGFGFLLGQWTCSGGGQPGQAIGTASVGPELNGTVLVMSGHIEFPATRARAAFAHDDRVTFYRDPADSSLRALYCDNERHVIRYRVTTLVDDSLLVAVSDAAPDGTHCRVTYVRTGEGRLAQRFEMAPPDRPDAYGPYVELTATRLAPPLR